jgi:hypothetical protein
VLYWSQMEARGRPRPQGKQPNTFARGFPSDLPWSYELTLLLWLISSSTSSTYAPFNFLLPHRWKGQGEALTTFGAAHANLSLI